MCLSWVARFVTRLATSWAARGEVNCAGGQGPWLIWHIGDSEGLWRCHQASMAPLIADITNTTKTMTITNWMRAAVPLAIPLILAITRAVGGCRLNRP